MNNKAFFDWVFERHHNQWSWYLRPIFLIPFCFFAYKRSWAGISITVFCLFTSMFWFNKPEWVCEQVQSFLEFEKDWLYGKWDFKKILLILTVPISFIALGLAFWKRSLILGLLVVVLMATGKIIWSILNAGSSGQSIIIPAALGLFICLGLIYFGFRRLENRKINRIRYISLSSNQQYHPNYQLSKMRKLLAFFLFFINFSGFSQINTLFVKPILTDPNYTAVQDSHMVIRNSSTQLNKLFLFLGGTNSSTQSYQAICIYAAQLGYDVINLSYINSIAAASLANNSDSLVFYKYRQEVCYGTPISPDVSVDSLNSIFTRTLKLIQYLHATYPSQNWNQYLINSTTINWSKIAVAGHSQGGGHACYLAKSHDVDRVLMFSSPNDYSNYYNHAANWLRTAGSTSINKHFAYLSVLDEVVSFDKQLHNLQGLGLYPFYDTTFTDNLNPPYSYSHCLYTKQTPGLAILYHNSTVKQSSINQSVWNYMLTSETSTGIENNITQNRISIYPNPASSSIYIQSQDILIDKIYYVYTSTGQLLMSGRISNSNSIDISELKAGLYFIKLDGWIGKLIKQ